MGNIYFFSGPCGCGKTTLTNAFAEYLLKEKNIKQLYIIHGDDFHEGFIEADSKEEYYLVNKREGNGLIWEEILEFNWDCIISVARKVLQKGLDVVIDYVIEEELPLVQKLAEEFNAKLFYVVLTASEDSLKQRISQRGDTELIERAIFLKNKLDNLVVNQGHLFDNTGMTIEDELKQLDIANYLV